MQYYYDALRDIYAEICKEERHRPKFIKEYGGYRTTASGYRVDRDQPNKSLEDQQSDAIRRNQMIRDKKAALNKLKKLKFVIGKPDKLREDPLINYIPLIKKKELKFTNLDKVKKRIKNLFEDNNINGKIIKI